MKIFYKNLMAIVITIASVASGFCSDISITINHAVSPYNGSISITLDDNSNGPYTYVLTGPVNITFTNSDLVNDINDLPVGDYCLTVTNADGCTAEVCFAIKRCQRWKGKVFCNQVIALPIPTGIIMLVGHDDDGKLKGNTFDVLTEIEDTYLDNIMPSIMETVHQETDNILLTGTSPYLVLEQNEIEDDNILFLYSFDDTGALQWVYYSGENADDGRIDDGSSSRNSFDNFDEVKISPNPVINDLLVELNPDLNYQKLEIYSSSGQLMMERKIGGDLDFSINVEHLNAGMYFIQFSGAESREMKRFIKN